MGKHGNESHLKTIAPYSRTWDHYIRRAKIYLSHPKNKISCMTNTDVTMAGTSCVRVDLHGCHLGCGSWREILKSFRATAYGRCSPSVGIPPPHPQFIRYLCLYTKTTAALAKRFAVHTIVYKNNEIVLVSHAEA